MVGHLLVDYIIYAVKARLNLVEATLVEEEESWVGGGRRGGIYWTMNGE